MKRETDHDTSLIEELIDLYLSIKLRSREEIEQYRPEIHQHERETLKMCSAHCLVEYIRRSVEILVNLRKPSDSEASSKEITVKSDVVPHSEARDYEKLLQISENDLRIHIRLEQQLKIHIENLQSELELRDKEFEKSQVSLNKKINQLQTKLGEAKVDIKYKEKAIRQLEEKVREQEKTCAQWYDKLCRMSAPNNRSRSSGKSINISTTEGRSHESGAERSFKSNRCSAVPTLTSQNRKSFKGLFEIYANSHPPQTDKNEGKGQRWGESVKRRRYSPKKDNWLSNRQGLLHSYNDSVNIAHESNQPAGLHRFPSELRADSSPFDSHKHRKSTREVLDQAKESRNPCLSRPLFTYHPQYSTSRSQYIDSSTGNESGFQQLSRGLTSSSRRHTQVSSIKLKEPQPNPNLQNHSSHSLHLANRFSIPNSKSQLPKNIKYGS